MHSSLLVFRIIFVQVPRTILFKNARLHSVHPVRFCLARFHWYLDLLVTQSKLDPKLCNISNVQHTTFRVKIVGHDIRDAQEILRSPGPTETLGELKQSFVLT